MEATAAGYGSQLSISAKSSKSRTPTPTSGKVSPSSSTQRSSSSSPRRGSPTSPAGPVRSKRTFMACTECRRRQVKCNPSSAPGQPCERCARRRIKCEYLTRQEQQLQSTNEWDPSYMASSGVTLCLPQYGQSTSQVQNQGPVVSASFGGYNPEVPGVSPEPILMNAGYNTGSWSLQSMSDLPVQRQPATQEYYGASLAPSASMPPNINVSPNQQVMGSYGHDGALYQVPSHQLAQGTSAQWYPGQEQQFPNVQDSNPGDATHPPQSFPQSSSAEWQWQNYYLQQQQQQQ